MLDVRLLEGILSYCKHIHRSTAKIITLTVCRYGTFHSTAQASPTPPSKRTQKNHHYHYY